MPPIRRSQRQALQKHFIKYYTDESCTEAKNTTFSDWMLFWRNGDLIKPDLKVCVEGQTYLLHSHILMFWSEYFQENLRDHKPYMFEVRDMKQGSFKAVLEFMYHGNIILSEDLGSIIGVANQLRITSILMICAHYIIVNLKRNSPFIAHVVELLYLSGNEYAMKIIMPKLFKRWDKFGSDEVLRKIPFKVLKLMISCSNTIPRLHDGNLIDICCQWIAADIDRRFCYTTELLECVTGKINTSWNFSFIQEKPKNIAEVKAVFHGLLHCCIQSEKIDFFHYFGLVIKKEHDPVINRMIGDENLLISSCSQFYSELTAQQNRISSNTIQTKISRFYFKQWSDRMKVLQCINTSSDIIVQVHASQEYKLDYWILCVSSKFFRDLEADSRNYVRLDLTNDEFVSVLNFMYGEILHISPDNVCNIIRASRLLKINSCQKLILNYIRKNMASLDMLKLFESSYCVEYDEVFEFVKNKILKNFDNFEKLSISCLRLDCFKMLVSSSSKLLRRISIDEKLDLCCDWIIRDIRNRYVSGLELIKTVGYLEGNNVKSLTDDFDVKFWKKYFSTFTSSIRDKPKLGRDFVVSIPRIDLSAIKNRRAGAVQHNTIGKPFRIILPRLKPKWKSC